MSKAPHVGDNILLHCGRLTSHHSHQAREGEMSPSLFLLFGRRVMSLASEVAVEVQQLAHLWSRERRHFKPCLVFVHSEISYLA